MDKFLSRKFVVTMMFTLLVAGRDALGIKIDDDSILALAGVVAAYLAAQGWIDGKEKA
jgi:hypothetical protein